MNQREWIARIGQTVGHWGCLKFFPTDQSAREGIIYFLERMVSEEYQLRWLENTMIDQVGIWNGPQELRGVFCTRFKPKDGIEANCATTVGFTPLDQEQRYIEQHREGLGPSKDARLAETMSDLVDRKKLQ